MANNDVHVVPAGNEWAVVIPGEDERNVFATQEAAIEAGKKRAQAHKVELLIHGRDGQIRVRSSFGNDPENVRG